MPENVPEAVPESEIRELFRRRFHEDPVAIAVAPGRINLIGEHTDYNDGFVFPAAIDRVTMIAASPCDGATELWSEQFGEAQPFEAGAVLPGEVTGWAVYPAGMAWALRTGTERDIETGSNPNRLPNLKGVVTSTVPHSGGVSSSAALELAVGTLWNHIARLGLSPKQLALAGQRCENGFVGVNSGIMDQMASAMGREGHAMFMDTRSLKIEYAPIPADLVAVSLDTQKPRALTTSAYNERRSQCESAALAMGVLKLRDASMAMLESCRGRMTEVEFRRARHVITENERCVEFKAALSESRLVEIGRLMRASHESLRDDYEVSCRELDAMAESAWNSPGCVGARMMGGGFGGSCIALVKSDLVKAFGCECLSRYKGQVGLAGEAMMSYVCSGARIVP